MYGISLITKSYTVLIASLFAHIMQLSFLHIVENPRMKTLLTLSDIEKIYRSMDDKPDERMKLLYSGPTAYFRKDFIAFNNLDLLRAPDFFFVLFFSYNLILAFLRLPSSFYITQALFWRLLHFFGIGCILLLQSNKKFYSKHFIRAGGDNREAFMHWKRQILV